MNATGIRQREEIEEQFKWRLEDIYPDETLWENDFKQVKDLVGEISALQGRLSQSGDVLLKTLQLSDDLGRIIEKLYVYSRMRRDENNANHHYQALFDRVQGLGIEVGSATAFIVPEILSMDKEILQRFMSENEDLALYKYFMEETLRQKEHILSESEERLMAMTADLSTAASHIFTMLNNADIKFPFIKNEAGVEVELTKGRYGSFMESSDRRVRRDAFQALYSSYNKMLNTIGASFSSSVKKDIFYAKARKYPSALAASLDQDNVPESVYNQLIESIHNNMDYMYRYIELRKKMLDLDELHMYDIYTPLVKDYKLEVPYEKAKEIVIAALQPLGEEYINIIKQGLNNRWIDVYENEGKTSGAYSWGCYDSNPYVLMNYDNKLDDVFTLAHEMGHSLHSYYSDRNQPYIYSQYAIFVAEVASTVNESLLIDYLLKKSQSREEKMYLINHYLEQFRGTVYRQTMFAEFEKIVHEHAEKGEAIVSEYLNNTYLELNRLYYGENIVLDDEIKLEWARIPHFYNAFYVYKYATGFSAATAIKEQILSEGAPAVKRYIEFLSSGGSDYPINLLQKTGVDLTTPAPVNKALQYFGYLLAELEKLV